MNLTEIFFALIIATAGWFKLNIIAAHIGIGFFAFFFLGQQIQRYSDKGEVLLPQSGLAVFVLVLVSGIGIYWFFRKISPKPTAQDSVVEKPQNENQQLMELKKCPHCAEDVKQEAIKCKHCGEAIA